MDFDASSPRSSRDRDRSRALECSLVLERDLSERLLRASSGLRDILRLLLATEYFQGKLIFLESRENKDKGIGNRAVRSSHQEFSQVEPHAPYAEQLLPGGDQAVTPLNDRRTSSSHFVCFRFSSHHVSATCTPSLGLSGAPNSVGYGNYSKIGVWLFPAEIAMLSLVDKLHTTILSHAVHRTLPYTKSTTQIRKAFYIYHTTLFDSSRTWIPHRITRTSHSNFTRRYPVHACESRKAPNASCPNNVALKLSTKTLNILTLPR